MKTAAKCSLFVAAVCFLALASSAVARAEDLTQHLRISKSEGSFWHDLYISYNGNVKLTDAEVTVVFYFQNGTRESKKAFYGTWNTGSQQTLWVNNQSQGRVERVDVIGTARGPDNVYHSLNGQYRW